jgi:hypothetical protein
MLRCCLLWLAWALPADGTDEERLRAEFPPMSLERDPEPEEPGSPRTPWRTFEANLGAHYWTVTSTLLLGKSGIPSSLTIPVEDLLGMNRELWSPECWISFRPWALHRIQFSFDDLSRTATREVSQGVVAGQVVFPASVIHSEYGVQFYNLNYAFSFLQDERMDIALTLGVDVIRTRVKLESQIPQHLEEERLIVPVPLPGFQADFALSRSFWLRQRLGAVYIPLENFSGLMVDYKLSVEWCFLDNVSLGIGVDLFHIALTKEANDTQLGTFDGKLKVEGTAALLYLNFHW